MSIRGQIHDLLEQHGPMTAAQIRAIENFPNLRTTLGQMVRERSLKRKGKHRNAVYALLGQGFRAKAKTLALVPVRNGARAPALAKIQQAPDFIPALTADKRMVLVYEGVPACIFTPEQTRQINALLIEHMS